MPRMFTHSRVVSRLAFLAIGLAAGTVSFNVSRAASPTTPIQYVIVVVGENQTFDTVFATYAPPPGESVRNLLSEGIIQADGTPGPEYSRAMQDRAVGGPHYTLDPVRAGRYEHLPQPTLIGVLNKDLRSMGQAPDPRFPADLPPGPFQVTRYAALPAIPADPTLATAVANLGAATEDPVHRFFQMWQQTGGDNARLDLYTWVPVTTGMGGDTVGVTRTDTGQGGGLMGFVNIAAGDAPLFLDLARHYAMSDNHHQSIMGGTGPNFISLATADEVFFNVNGAAATPPPNQIENPDPQPGTENFYQRDGYSGGSYVECADSAQPGVAPILARLTGAGVASNCEPGHYYLVNNYSAGYDLDGHLQPIGPNNFNYPPQTVRTFAEALAAGGVSWDWYIGARDRADLKDEVEQRHMTLAAARRLQYNDIGDPLVGSQVVMTHRELRSHLKGLASFSADLQRDKLPAVSFVVPKNLDSGHPGNSVLASFEDFLASIIDQVKARPEIWAHAAIIVTTDEGGGHFDSGYIQTVDFFGDGPRIPLLVVSPYARAGHIDHVYSDHASILKFIEHNWGLAPITSRSRDRLPNPVSSPVDPYRPLNGPAVGDLTTLFNFQ
jgi:acid phosphatase